MLKRLKAAWEVIYNRLGDPRTKNVALVVLAVMSGFGMIAPSTATSIRDAILSMVF